MAVQLLVMRLLEELSLTRMTISASQLYITLTIHVLMVLTTVWLVLRVQLIVNLVIQVITFLFSKVQIKVMASYRLFLPIQSYEHSGVVMLRRFFLLLKFSIQNAKQEFSVKCWLLQCSLRELLWARNLLSYWNIKSSQLWSWVLLSLLYDALTK